jgi:uncharacterized protein (DUF1015 family)
VIFPHDQVQILPYNRALKDLNGMKPDQLLHKLATVFAVSPRPRLAPTKSHEVCLFLNGHWITLQFKPKLLEKLSTVEQLDVNLLQKHVLGPIFGIADPRTSNRITFVGGIRGTHEMEAMVKSGQHACAFSMFPTTVDELLAVADGGGVMPPKSTWFEPKLRDGLFSHLI